MGLKIALPLRPMFQKYDVIVVGAGHAGCEAAAARKSWFKDSFDNHEYADYCSNEL